MRLSTEIAVTLSGIALLSWTFGIDGLITGILCWWAINAVLAGRVGASALACGLFASCSYFMLIAYQVKSLPHPVDRDIPFMAPFVAIWLSIIAAILGMSIAICRKNRAKPADTLADSNAFRVRG